MTIKTNPHRLLRGFCYALFILLLSVAGQTPGAIPAIWGARPLLAVPLTVCAAAVTGPGGGGAAGLFTGFLWDAYSPDRPAGYHALLLMLLGCAVGLLFKLRLRRNLFMLMIVMAGALAVVGGPDWLLWPATRSGAALLYTWAVTPILYWIIRLISHIRNKRHRKAHTWKSAQDTAASSP